MKASVFYIALIVISPHVRAMSIQDVDTHGFISLENAKKALRILNTALDKNEPCENIKKYFIEVAHQCNCNKNAWIDDNPNYHAQLTVLLAEETARHAARLVAERTIRETVIIGQHAENEKQSFQKLWLNAKYNAQFIESASTLNALSHN